MIARRRTLLLGAAAALVLVAAPPLPAHKQHTTHKQTTTYNPPHTCAPSTLNPPSTKTLITPPLQNARANEQKPTPQTTTAPLEVASSAPPAGKPAATPPAEPAPKLPWLDRLLPLWIIAAMGAGIGLGVGAPGAGEALGVAHIGEVSLPIALGLWLMMWCVFFGGGRGG